MPVLPDSATLGPVKGFNSNAPAAQTDTSGILQSGTDALARGVRNAGDSAAYVAADQQAKRTELETATADSNFITNKVKLDEARDNLTDPVELQAHREKYAEARDTAGSVITDPAAKQKFLLRYNPTVAQSEVSVNDRVFEIKKDEFTAKTHESLNDLSIKGAQAKDEPTRVAAITAGNKQIQGLLDNGYIDEVQAQQMRQSWGTNFTVNWLNTKPPQQRLEALQGDVTPNASAKSAYDFYINKGWKPVQASAIVASLYHESGGMRFGAINRGDGADGSDSIGVGQWNAERAERLKRYAAARGTSWHDNQTQLEFVDLELRTSEGAAGQALINAGNSRDAAAAMVAYERPKGSDRGAENALGWSNRLRYTQTFFNKFGGGPAAGNIEGSDIAGKLPIDTRLGMIHQAQREIVAGQQQLEQQNRENQTRVSLAVDNDVASMRATGQGAPPDKINRDMVAATLGDTAADKWVSDRFQAQKVYDALHDIKTVPESEVVRRVESLAPKSGSSNFIEEDKTYRSADKQAKAFIDARLADPARAVNDFPAVRDARQSVQSADQQGTIQPGAYQAIVAARMQAQKQLEIQDPRALTKGESKLFAQQLRYNQEKGGAALVDFLGQLQNTYGVYAKDVLLDIFQHEGIATETQEAAVDVLDSLTRSKEMPRQSRQAMETAIDFPASAEHTSALEKLGRLPVQAAQAAASPAGVSPYSYYDIKPYEAPAGSSTMSPIIDNSAPAPQGDELQRLSENRNDKFARDIFDRTYGVGQSDRYLSEIDRRLKKTKPSG